MLSESQFDQTAELLLSSLAEQIEDADSDGMMDVDYQDGVLTIELESGQTFVVNKHRPTQQIWLSSPLSGAAYFEYDNDDAVFYDKHGGDALHDVLQRELSELTGMEMTLSSHA